jgi:hypothetical protein
MDLQKEVSDFKKEISENRDGLLTNLNYILSLDFIVKKRLPVDHEWHLAGYYLEVIWRCSDNLINSLNSLIDPIKPLRINRQLIEALYGVISIEPGERITMAMAEEMVEKMREGVDEILYHFNNDVLPEIDSWARQVFENQKAELHY